MCFTEILEVFCQVTHHNYYKHASTLHTVYFIIIIYSVQSFPRPSCQWSSPTLLSLSPLPRPLHPLTGILGYNNGVTQARTVDVLLML